MLLAVFSDSHGRGAAMAAAVDQYRPDAVFFLGDGVRDAETIRQKHPEMRFIILRGNCDHDYSYPEDAILKLEGVGIFAAHGHNHAVKYGLDKFCNSVWCSGSRLGLYGHTHRALWEEFRGMQILNPGSIGDRLHPTFALVTLENSQANCRIIDAPAAE